MRHEPICSNYTGASPASPPGPSSSAVDRSALDRLRVDARGHARTPRPFASSSDSPCRNDGQIHGMNTPCASQLLEKQRAVRAVTAARRDRGRQDHGPAVEVALGLQELARCRRPRCGVAPHARRRRAGASELRRSRRAARRSSSSPSPPRAQTVRRRWSSTTGTRARRRDRDRRAAMIERAAGQRGDGVAIGHALAERDQVGRARRTGAMAPCR